MNIYWYEQILALEALIHSYEMLHTFHEGNYGFTDEQEKEVSNWRSLIWERIEELTKAMERDFEGDEKI